MYIFVCSSHIVAFAGEGYCEAPVKRRMSFVKLEGLRIPVKVKNFLGITWTDFLGACERCQSTRERLSIAQHFNWSAWTSRSVATKTLSQSLVELTL